MKRFLLFIMGIVLPSLLFAQNGNWERMPDPYFVYDATGVSIGWQEGTQYTYMIASDLQTKKAYCSDVNGSTYWPDNRQYPIAAAVRINACKNYGRYAAAFVPSTDENPNPNPGVWFTINGGISWTYNENSQPEATNLSCVAMDPADHDICYAGAIRPSIDDNLLWTTWNGGQSWSALGPTGEEIYSVRFFDWQIYQFLWVCSENSGLWRYMFPYFVRFNYAYGGEEFNGLDITITPGFYPNAYMLTEKDIGDDIFEYKLFHSDNLTSWTEMADFGQEKYFEIINTSTNVDTETPDTIWVMKDDNIRMLEVLGPNIISEINFPSVGNNYRWIDYTPAGIEGSYPVIYVAKQYSMEKLTYDPNLLEWVFQYRLDGTNKANAVKVSEAIGALSDGGGLYSIAENGGYVFINKQVRDSNWPNTWEFRGTLLDEPQATNHGTDISAYYDGDEVKYIAIGYNLENEEYTWLTNDDGQDVTLGEQTPISLDVCAGKRSPTSVVPSYPYVGGKCESVGINNILWEVRGSYAPRYYIDGTPFFKDMVLLEDTSPGFNSFYPFCIGDAFEQPSGSLVKYVRPNNDYFELDFGLISVNVLSSVAESDEPSASSATALYTGTKDVDVPYLGGIYKANFDFTPNCTWRQVSQGLPENLEYTSIVTTKHLIDCGEPLDELTVFALGKDSNNSPYLYISPDSGRQWIEIGGYLRDVIVKHKLGICLVFV